MKSLFTMLSISRLLPFILSVLCFQLCIAQMAHENIPVTNGRVSSLVRDGNTIYIGGNFTGLGPNVPKGSSISTTTGLPNLNYVKPNDYVNTVVSDGAGGWYIGGEFTQVGAVARNYIAKINADGSLNSWNPGADGYINTLALSGNTLYVGGNFSNIGGQPRNSLASFNTTTGALNSWNPDAPNGDITTIAIDGGKVYIGGNFSMIGSEFRYNIAALDASTGSVTTWAPDADGGVTKILINGGVAYVGGSFTLLGGQARNNIGAISTTTGFATSWDPDADELVITMAISGTTLYVGGEFTTIGGASRDGGIAALSLSTGNAILECSWPYRRYCGIFSGFWWFIVYWRLFWIYWWAAPA